MIHRIQKQHCIWPQNWAPEQTVIQSSRLDKVIGLVPQGACLFKIYTYEQDLIARSDIAQCIANEIENLDIWPRTQHYYLVFKQAERWQVVVWLWDKDSVEFIQPVTHILPALAYELGRVPSKPALLLYGEGEDSWACYLGKANGIDTMMPLSSRIHRTKVQQELNAGHYTVYQAGNFSTKQETELFGHVPLEFAALLSQPKNYVLDSGRVASLFDFNSPWRFYRPIGGILAGILLCLLLDYSLLNLKGSQVTQQKSDLSLRTEDLVNQRSQQLDIERVLSELNVAFVNQQRLASLLEAMTITLEKDVVLNQLLYRDNKVELQGQVVDSVALLERLSALSQVAQARFIGDITPNKDGQQTFRIELILLTAAELAQQAIKSDN